MFVFAPEKFVFVALAPRSVRDYRGVSLMCVQQTQQHLAEEVEDQLTGEEALELAMSLGI